MRTPLIHIHTFKDTPFDDGSLPVRVVMVPQCPW